MQRTLNRGLSVRVCAVPEAPIGKGIFKPDCNVRPLEVVAMPKTVARPSKRDALVLRRELIPAFFVASEKGKVHRIAAKVIATDEKDDVFGTGDELPVGAADEAVRPFNKRCGAVDDPRHEFNVIAFTGSTDDGGRKFEAIVGVDDAAITESCGEQEAVQIIGDRGECFAVKVPRDAKSNAVAAVNGFERIDLRR